MQNLDQSMQFSIETMRIAVGIATRGRAETLRETLAELRLQTRLPDRVIVCGTAPEDVAGCAADHRTTFLSSLSGLPRQRNRILDEATDCDILLFLDDDFLPAPRYVEATLACFVAQDDVVVTTGTTVADDIQGPGLAPAAGRALLIGDAAASLDLRSKAARHGYGCNMAIRLEPARRFGVRFDERLPLYGWSEDVDYTHRLARYGRILKLSGARGVHLAVKRGRSSGRPLGYSQVANPIYLRSKGSYTWGRALRSVGRNILANTLRSFRPEPYVDRRGRLAGNGLAMVDLVRGRLAPERILEL